MSEFDEKFEEMWREMQDWREGYDEGYEDGWKAAMRMIRNKEEQARQNRRAMCGRILRDDIRYNPNRRPTKINTDRSDAARRDSIRRLLDADN